MFDDGHEMGRMLITQASLAATEKRVEECIHCVCEAQVYFLQYNCTLYHFDLLEQTIQDICTCVHLL